MELEINVSEVREGNVLNDPITENEEVKVVSKLKNDKSSGLYNIIN